VAFWGAHVRRYFLNAGLSFAVLHGWALVCMERIGTRYHHTALRLQPRNSERTLRELSVAFTQPPPALQTTLQRMHGEATRGGGA
jgi:hypothetical protein